MTARLLTRWAASLALVLALCGQIAIPNSRRYSNVDYQFAVNIPHGLRGCMTARPNPNHGLWIPLDRSRCDDPDERPPYIGIHADYNAAGDADTAAGLAAIECHWRMPRHIVWLHDERISGRKAAGCRRSFDDGHLEVAFIVLRKTGRNPLSWIEISADLITTPARYTGDMHVFQQVLRGVWVHPDGPQS
jgi:hypothetical protein